MPDREDNGYALFRRIHDSRGMAVLNRMKARSFSLNVFQVNAKELMDAMTLVENPQIGVLLMMEKNRDAGDQAHRDVGRLFHNFLAGAKTLVDHTRAFMEEHYKRTDLLKRYEAKIAKEVAPAPICLFVHDLRNLMLHKGFPSTEMFLNLSRDNGMTSGIALKVDDLTAWSRWNPASKRFLSTQEKSIPLSRLCTDYAEVVLSLHNWLNEEISAYHKHDLDELAAMQGEYRTKYGRPHDERLRESDFAEEKPETNEP